MPVFTDIVKGMPNGAEALQSNFGVLTKSIEDVTDDGVMHVKGLETDNLVAPMGVFEKVATIIVSGSQFKNEVHGTIYKSGPCYLYYFAAGETLDVKTRMTSGTNYEADIAIDGITPNVSPWIVTSGATNATQASLEITLVDANKIRIKTMGSDLNPGQYVRLGNFMFFA